MRLLILCFLVFNSFSFYAQSNDDYTKGIVDFSIFNIEGETFTQDDLTTEKYKLLMYFNPSCSSCKTAFKKINLVADKLNDLPVHFYPVSLGKKEETLAFFAQYAPDFMTNADTTILLEKDYQFSDSYEVNAYPTLFLYKPNNNFAKSYMGHQKATDFLEYFKQN